MKKMCFKSKKSEKLAHLETTAIEINFLSTSKVILFPVFPEPLSEEMIATSQKFFLQLLHIFHIARINLEMKSNMIIRNYLVDLILD